MSRIKIINIKFDLPKVEEARERLKQEIIQAYNNGDRFLKIIHGYGSTGVGGRLRQAIRKSLLLRQKEGLVEHIIFGEKFDNIYNHTESIIQKYPILKSDIDYKRKNEGITILILSKKKT